MLDGNRGGYPGKLPRRSEYPHPN